MGITKLKLLLIELRILVALLRGRGMPYKHMHRAVHVVVHAPCVWCIYLASIWQADSL